MLLDGMIVPAWTRRMLERIRDLPSARVEVAVIASHEDGPPTTGGPLRRVARRLRAALERRVIDAARGGDDAFAPVDVSDLLAGVPTLTAPRGDRFDEDEIRRLAARGLDVLLDLGSSAAGGGSLEAARHGIWTHWSESEVEGFWETAESRPVIRTTLQQRTAQGTKTLYESTSTVDPTCVATTRNRAYWKTASFVPRALDKLHGGGEQAFPDGGTAAAAAPPVRRRAGAAAQMRFLAKRFVERRRIKLKAKLYHEQWLLLFSFGATAPGDYRGFKKLVPPRDRFWADPYVFRRDDRYYVFVEEYLYATHRAHLSVLVLKQDGTHTAPVPIITQPHHLSYPHLFTWHGELYLVPESKANRTIEVYRCTEFPHRWTLETRLMENVDAVDATLLEHGGRWWLFANLVENRGASSWDELYLFSADSPLSNTWTPHPANPIVSDVTRARPAGRIFLKDGKLYRPSQNSAYRYGYGLNINEITELTESRYSERVVARTEPTWDPEIFGVHTLAADGGLTVIDGLRRCSRWL